MPKSLSIPVPLIFFLAALSAGAQTNFGPVDLGSSATQTVTVTIPSATTFNKISVVTEGAAGLDFTAAGTGTCATGVAYAAGQTCTVGVIFKPLYSGLRMGAVTLSNGGAGVYDTTYLQGTGAGPQIAFTPGISTASVPELNGSSFINPESFALDGNETIYIVDQQLKAGSILKVPAGSSNASPISANGLNGHFVTVVDAVAIDGAGNRIIAGEDKDSRALAVRIPPGASAGTEYRDTSYQSGEFSGVAVDGAGDLFLLNYNSGDVVEYPSSPSNAPPIYYTPQVNGLYLSDPVGLAVDAEGNIYIGDTQNHFRLVEIPAGGGAAVALDPIVEPYGRIAVDGVGNLFFSDFDYFSIFEVPVGGGPVITIPTLANGQYFYPQNPAFDPQGNLFMEGYTSGGPVSLLAIQRSITPREPMRQRL